MTTPEQIIEAFDECLSYIFGAAFARENPHKSDHETAEKWLDDGVSLTLAAMVFYNQMSRMHEKHLHIHDKSDRSMVPGTLKLFDENIEAAIRRRNTGGVIDTWEAELSRWRSRCRSWIDHPDLWRTEMWGPPPFAPGCRAPKSVVDELKEKH